MKKGTLSSALKYSQNIANQDDTHYVSLLDR